MSAFWMWALLSSASPVVHSPAVGLQTIEVEDPARQDPVSPSHLRRWRVDIYYPARPSEGSRLEVYAPDSRLVADLADWGYYDVTSRTLAGWTQKTGAAYRDAPADRPGKKRPLITVAPGSGVAAFNYSRLAAAMVEKGYVVAVVDLPYMGISRLADGRLLRAGDLPALEEDDPQSWRPVVRAWSRDISTTVDYLVGRPSPAQIDPQRIVITGHSLGGAVALQVCHDDLRVLGCANFEGAPNASDAFDSGVRQPIFVTASRSAKPDRPFTAPDLSKPFWSYLTKSGDSAWAVAVTKASHMSYSDAPFEMPDTLTRFGGELMSPERSFDVLTGLVDAFARAYAPGGGGDAAFRTLVETTPEVQARSAGDAPSRK